MTDAIVVLSLLTTLFRINAFITLYLVSIYPSSNYFFKSDSLIQTHE